MDNILVSIIIPVYNSEKYLRKCIESVLNQILKNCEIILVDDGSTDHSIDICREYEKNFNNIKVYSQTNVGQGAARNNGMKVAKGNYIGFVDSDDRIDPNMYKSLLEAATVNDCDICICGNEKFYKYNDIHDCNKDAIYKIETDNEKILKSFLLQKISSYSCDKIYKRKLLLKNNIKFPEGYYFEDINFVLKSLYYSRKIAITEENFYKYLQRSDSTTFIRSKKHLKDFEVQVNEMFKFINKNEIFDSRSLELRNCKFIYTNMLLKMMKSLNIEEELKNKFESLSKKLIVFGASSAGELMKYYCDKFNIKVVYFSDNSKEKWGKKLNDIEIISPQHIKKIKNCNIYIASMYYKEIYDQLDNYGLQNKIIDLNIF